VKRTPAARSLFDAEPRPRSAAGPARPAWTLALLAVAALVVATAGGLFGERVDAPAAAATPESTPTSTAPDGAAANVQPAPAATASPGGASTKVATPVAAGFPEQRFATIALDARQLMADVAIARLALGAELEGDARDHVEAAMPIAARLIADRAPGDPAWLPLQDEERVVRTLDDSLARRHEQPLLAAEAHAVRTHRALDPKLLLAKLHVADEALIRGDPVAAATALEGAEASVVAETNVRDLPLERVHDNLVLARELATDREFTGAADALGFARAALADAELADGTLRRRPEVAELQREIAALQAQLGPAEPAGLHALRERLHGWWTNASAWLTARAG
jgi:hypothetical protein